MVVLVFLNDQVACVYDPNFPDKPYEWLTREVFDKVFDRSWAFYFCGDKP